jgi:hypothetical protein
MTSWAWVTLEPCAIETGFPQHLQDFAGRVHGEAGFPAKLAVVRKEHTGDPGKSRQQEAIAPGKPHLACNVTNYRCAGLDHVRHDQLARRLQQPVPGPQ